MNRRAHADYARALLDKWTSLGEAVDTLRIAGRKCSVGVLSTYQNAAVDAYMPADIIGILEASCGKPIYSQALSDAVAEPPLTGELSRLIYSLTEESAGTQRRYHDAIEDNDLSFNEIGDLRRQVMGINAVSTALQRTLAEAEAALEAKNTGLRAV